MCICDKAIWKRYVLLCLSEDCPGLSGDEICHLSIACFLINYKVFFAILIKSQDNLLRDHSTQRQSR